MKRNYKRGYSPVLIYKTIGEDISMEYRVVSCYIIGENERQFEDGVSKKGYDIVEVEEGFEGMNDDLLEYELTGSSTNIYTVTEMYDNYEDAKERCLELNNDMNNSNKKVFFKYLF